MIVAANEPCCDRPLTGRIVLICLIAFFAVVSIANGIMIRAAVTTFGGVETGELLSGRPCLHARHRPPRRRRTRCTGR